MVLHLARKKVMLSYFYFDGVAAFAIGCALIAFILVGKRGVAPWKQRTAEKVII